MKRIRVMPDKEDKGHARVFRYDSNSFETELLGYLKLSNERFLPRKPGLRAAYSFTYLHSAVRWLLNETVAADGKNIEVVPSRLWETRPPVRIDDAEAAWLDEQVSKR